MGNNENSSGKGLQETIVGEAKGVALEVYKDAAKPAVTAIGTTIGGVAKLLMWPVELVTRTANAALEKLATRVEGKLRGVESERLLSPPATIAAQATLHYALLGDGDEVEPLRDMFATLLAASMDRQRTSVVHPSFVTIISQLTPDEAWLLKSISSPNAVLPVIEARAVANTGALPPQDARSDELDFHERPVEGGYTREGWITDLGIGIGIDEMRQEQYLSNLIRLGILEIDFMEMAMGESSEEEYRDLRRRMRERKARVNHRLIGQRGVISVTPLGGQFLSSCVISR